MLYAVIITSEVLFWVFLLAGLTARYPLRSPRLGAALLVCAPLVDLITLAAAVIDLRGGAEPSFAHVLAAIYIGVSVGFGHSMMRWTDVRFAHRFADGPAPERVPERGPAKAAHERVQLVRHVVSWAIGAGLMTLAALLVGTPAAEQTFLGAAGVWSAALVIDAVWSLSYTLVPGRAQS